MSTTNTMFFLMALIFSISLTSCSKSSNSGNLSGERNNSEQSKSTNSSNSAEKSSNESSSSTSGNGSNSSSIGIKSKENKFSQNDFFGTWEGWSEVYGEAISITAKEIVGIASGSLSDLGNVASHKIRIENLVWEGVGEYNDLYPFGYQLKGTITFINSGGGEYSEPFNNYIFINADRDEIMVGQDKYSKVK